MAHRGDATGRRRDALCSSSRSALFRPPTDQPKDDPGGFGSALPELVDGPYKSAAAILELLEAAPASASAAMVAALDAIGDAEKRK
jgi:hypothetical protein